MHNSTDLNAEHVKQVTQKLNRLCVEELDEILGVPFKVLDDGFIRVIDYMGTDESIVQAARVSYGAGTKKIHEDKGLIRYLMRHYHTTPFEMCEIKLHVRVPMDTWRQWIRHRMANVNEYSTRYSIAIDNAQSTNPGEWRLQSTGNRQGSAGYMDEKTGSYFSQKEKDFQKLAREIYEERIAKGIAREQARKDLPLATYTEAYWKVDLHNLLNFLRLRMDEHAQEEIRMYANIIGNEILAKWCPIAWQAFKDYHINATSFTHLEYQIMQEILTGNNDKAIELAKSFGFLKEDGSLKQSRERTELEEKLKKLSIKIPWES
ncbi:MAG: FAD-dependent thymidylate synthase [Ignavibacteriae bacterium]|nr:MAG: FAD-dependent thymidylate synthase [Ignavibacteriota bacterium]